MVKKMNKLDLYITGASGFIGNCLIKHFKKYDNINVIGISFLKKNLKTKEIIYTDYKDIRWLRANILNENSIVIHTAAYIPKVSKDFFQRLTLDKNTQINKFICEAFLNKVSKIIYFSSISVYGYGYKNLINVIEDSPLLIKDYYAQSKIEGEKYFLERYNKSVYILRLSSPYGKYEGRKNILESMINKAINGESIHIYGEGNRTQDFIHIDDICNVIYKLINNNISTGIYNLASGYPCTMAHLAEVIINSTNSKSKIQYVDKEERDFVEINNDKLKTETAIKFISLEIGIKRMVNILKIKGE